MTVRLGRHAFCLGLAAALLAGCGGSQTALTGQVPQSVAQSRPHTAPGSWMLPGTSSEDLLYVAVQDIVKIYSYPGLQYLGDLSGLSYGASGLCTDSAGDVFAVSPDDIEQRSKIVGYKHGATSPFVTLDDGGHFPNSCAVDPTTGNLAVVGGANHLERSNIAIYPHAKGRHKMYYPPTTALQWCTYDNQGNLFANFESYGVSYDNGVYLLEMSHGSGAFTEITVSRKGYSGGDVQWDGTYLAVRNPYLEGPQTVYQVTVSGSVGKIVNTMTFTKRIQKFNPFAQFATFNGKFVTPTWKSRVGIWNYPKGGREAASFSAGGYGPDGLVVSVPGTK